jgi:AmmeMemoRadiSam system protein B
MMEKIRQPAVAGMFYPDDARELTLMVADFLSNAESKGDSVKAIIAPHAGYIYSGPIAGSAYALLSDCATTIERVVLLGPAHRVSVRGLAVSSAESFATPLGNVAIDTEAVQDVLALPQVTISDAAHAPEHSLEVHLPFLQSICPGIRIVPLVVGQATADEVEEVLDMLWGGVETVIVISSDLSHFYDYATAHTLDATTAEAIEALNPQALRYDSACGQVAIQGMLQVARKKGLHAQTIDLRNSGDTAGPRSRVVGYGAFIFA